ncbi:MAG: LLM class flavin-dependent oxidoreductase [Chloroflexi bacterium]|nr:LLM class flavin-dependent oxidoreductase [Chloroflexota bacterium]
MRIGIQIVGSRSSEMVPLARAAEAAGLDSVFFPTGGFYIGAMRVIDATERIRVGTGIIPMFQGTPYLHASTAIALQEMSGGRFVLGLGSQTKGQVRRMAGIDLDRPAARARDMIRAIRALMTEGRYEGEFYAADPPGGFSLRARHREVPPPPIHFSGVNRLNLRVAGEVADGLVGHPIFSARWMDEVVLPEVARGLERGGRSREDFEMCAMPMVWVVEGEATREEGYRRAKRNLANYYSTRAYGGFLELHGWGRERDAIRAVWQRAQDAGTPIDGREMEAIVSDAMADEVCLIGTPAELRDIARERFEGRADTLLLYPLHDAYATPDERDLRIRESEQDLYRAIDAFVPLASG